MVARPVRTVALVACCGEKADHPAPARELYQSHLFRLSLAYAERILGGEVYILSAQHGLVRLDQVLEPYDLSLREMDAEERAWWGHEVEMQLAEVLGAEHTHEEDAEPLHEFRWNFFLHDPRLRVVLLAGALCRPPEILGVTVEEPLAGMGIGQRKAWLLAALRGAELAPGDRVRRVGGDMPGRVVKVIGKKVRTGGSPCRLRVRWANGHEGVIERTQAEVAFDG